MKRHTRRKAFTLIELIVVMAVIGILVLLAAPKFLGYTQKAQETKHIHTAKVIETALEAYLINGGIFPDDLEVVDKTLLEESAGKESLIGVKGYVTTIDEETYYELTYDFIEKLDVKLSAKNELFIDAIASSVPTALYASEKGITLVDMDKTLKGYELHVEKEPIETNLEDAKQIVVGAHHSLVLTNSGTVMSWGYNISGQLGLGDTWQRKKPSAIAGLSNVKELAAGGSHTLALLNDGSVMAWGWNQYGQLGDGTTTQRNTPVAIGLSDVKQLSSGVSHNLALMNDGTVMAWGDNSHGQLGDGTKLNKSVPVVIEGLFNVKRLAAGDRHSLALLEDGTVMAWGLNFRGQLGDGTIIDRQKPVHVNGLSGFVKEIEASGISSQAIMSNGTVMTWGANDSGQIGNGTTNYTITPVTIDLIGVNQLSPGYAYSLALMSDGTIKAWGANHSGQLGDGTTSQRTTPTTLSYLSDVKQLASGGSHSLALMADGSIMSWGDNSNGQLGDGTNVNKIAPVNVLNSDGSNFNINQ